MKTNQFRYLLGSFMLILTIAVATAQPVTRTSYFMDNSTHKHLLNPALAPVRGYFSVPALGAFDLGLESNLKFTNFIYPASANSDGKLLTFMHPDVTAEEFLGGLNEMNYFNLNQRMSLVSFGFYAGRSFWTFDVAQRMNFNINLPYDLFAFMKEGMSSNNTSYNIEDLGINSSLLMEASLGSSFMIGKSLRIGVKGKVIGGAMRMKAGLANLDINMTPDSWDIQSDGIIELYGAGLNFGKDADEVVNDLNVAGMNLVGGTGTMNTGDFYSNGIAGMGYAADLGFVWKPIKFLTLSAGVTDLFGRINWNKDFIRTAKSTGSVSFSGLDGIALAADNGGGENSTVTELTDNLLKMTQFKEQAALNANVVEKLYPTINAGAELNMLWNRMSLGVLYSRQMREFENYQEITGSLNLRPFRWFNLSASYSHFHGNQESVGFAIGFVPLIANIYVACDYVPLRVNPQFIPLNTLTTNIQIGASIPLWRMKEKKVVVQD